jgi:hypothetical protein
LIGCSSIIWVFPLVIADSEHDIPGIKTGPLSWYTSALTTGLQEVSEENFFGPTLTSKNINLGKYKLKKIISSFILVWWLGS